MWAALAHCILLRTVTITAKNDQTPELLAELQAMPLEAKIALTQVRLDEFLCGYGGIEFGAGYVSFSGGKDSTVLLDITRKRYPDVRACFSNTGLEYPEIRKFAMSHDNIDVVQPKMRFDEVISTYGYPLISKEVAEAIYYARRLQPNERERQQPNSNEQPRKSPYCADGQNAVSKTTRRKRAELSGKRTLRKGRAGVEIVKSMFNKEKWLPLARDLPVMISHYCCQVIKKSPLRAYQKQHEIFPIIATMAEESRVRKQAWLRTGCNSFDGKIQSKPMSFWTEQDVLQYIVKYRIEICSVYGDIVAVDENGNEYDPRNAITPSCKLKCTGCDRTGCIYCGFGFHLEKGTTRFQRLAFTHPRQYEYCMGGGQWVNNPSYDPSAPKFDWEWQNWNPPKIWVPSKKGLGMKFVFDQCNEIYGKDFYRYE